MMSNTPNKTTDTDRDLQVKLETLSQIAEFINDGGGSFRKFIDYLNLDYCDAHEAGGMLISNTLHGERELQENKIKLIEQWRDWYWQAMLWNEARNTAFVRDHLNIADGLNLALSLIRGEERVLPAALDGFEDYKYGKYPDGR